MAAALRLSLQASWDSDEEASGAGSDANGSSSSSDEEEEKKGVAPSQEEAELTSNLHAIEVRCHACAMRAAPCLPPTPPLFSCCSSSCRRA